MRTYSSVSFNSCYHRYTCISCLSTNCNNNTFVFTFILLKRFPVQRNEFNNTWTAEKTINRQIRILFQIFSARSLCSSTLNLPNFNLHIEIKEILIYRGGASKFTLMVPLRNPPLLGCLSGIPNHHLLFPAQITTWRAEIRVRCPTASSSRAEVLRGTKPELNPEHHCPFPYLDHGRVAPFGWRHPLRVVLWKQVFAFTNKRTDGDNS